MSQHRGAAPIIPCHLSSYIEQEGHDEPGRSCSHLRLVMSAFYSWYSPEGSLTEWFSPSAPRAPPRHPLREWCKGARRRGAGPSRARAGR